MIVSGICCCVTFAICDAPGEQEEQLWSEADVGSGGQPGILTRGGRRCCCLMTHQQARGADITRCSCPFTNQAHVGPTFATEATIIHSSFDTAVCLSSSSSIPSLPVDMALPHSQLITMATW